MARVLCLILVLASSAPALAQAPSSLAPAATPDAGSVATALEGEATLDRLLDVLRDDDARSALVAALEAQATPPTEPSAPPGSLASRLAPAAADLAQDARAETGRLWRGLKALAALHERLPAVGAPKRQVGAALLATMLSTLAAMLAFDGIAGAVARRLRPGSDAGPARRAWRAGLALLAHAVALGLAWATGWALVVLVFTEDGRPWTSQILYLGGFLAFGLARVALRTAANPDADREPTLSPQPAPLQRLIYRRLRDVAGLVTQGVLFVVPLIRLWAGDAAADSGRALVATLAAAAALRAILAIVRATRAVADTASLADEAPVPYAGTDPPETLIGPPDPTPVAGMAASIPPPSTAPAAVAEGLGSAWRAAWPPLAVIYVVYTWFVAITRPARIEDLALLGTLASVGAILLVLAGLHLLRRSHRAALPVPPRLRALVPTLKPRADRIVAGLATLLAILCLLAAPLLVAMGWGWIDGWDLAARPGVRALGARGLSAALVVLLAAILWALVASWIDARLARGAAGQQEARARTLLALFRNAFTVAVVVMGGMVALSQVGLDIAPLLAGAGVVGLAIGFGAQTLVKDIITGIFIQIEGAIDVGDVVGVAGITGGVEKITIRSVRLRTMDGATHIIPFSSVTTVTNLTRDFGYHVAELVVGYGQSVSAVRDAMQEAFARLERDPLAADVEGALDMHGIAEMRGDSLLVRARIRTRPGRQWDVGRRYSDLLKGVLDERGIVVPVASRTILVADPAGEVHPGPGPVGAAPA